MTTAPAWGRSVRPVSQPVAVKRKTNAAPPHPPEKVLGATLNQWPADSEGLNRAEFIARLKSKRLSVLQEGLYLRPRGMFKAGPGIIVTTALGKKARFIVHDTGDGSTGPYRATLVQQESGCWLFVSLEGHCPSCLGSGILDFSAPHLCDTCGGEGWGVAECEPS